MLQFPPVLEQQAQLSWQKFIDQHPTFPEKLNEAQLTDFKNALALSDFVLNSALQAPELVVELFTSERIYQTDVANYAQLLNEQLSHCDDELALNRILRRFRLQQMVAIAVADMVLEQPLNTSLARLSQLADALILEALAWLTEFCKSKWGTPVDKDGIEQSLLVFGMGKLGGQELNFSSDIDLIFSYPDSGETIGARRSLDNQQFFIRLAQKLINALNQQTADGFVYRVDMRLRPFGDSGPLVMNFNAFEDYYQEQGRDWERYAMLKARLIGDGPYHQRLQTLLKPFVYRRYIDFSVIDSLRRMKMMIAQEVRRKNLVNNIKLGGGGIREIEFIVQVFQMIRGGRVTALQQRNLLTVLPLLVEHGEVSETSASVLEAAYRFLRRAENIIQALADQQTQTLPDNEIDQARLTLVMGFNSWNDFLVQLEQHMESVHREFGLLIGEEAPNNDAHDQHWQTLWHSQWDDEESIAWVKQGCHFWQADKVWQEVKNFRADISKRSMGNRGQQVLEKLIPLLLWQLQQEQADDQTLSRVLMVFSKIITRTAYLELLYENVGALKHLVKLCRASYWITEYIAKFPILLDELIDPKLLHNPPALSSYQAYLRESMLRVPEDDLEAQMNHLRQFKQAQQLRIAAADVAGVLPITKVSDHLTALAEAIIAEVVSIAWQQVSIRFGVPKSSQGQIGKGFGVVGYGKVGGTELGYSSDLDLVFIHNSPTNDTTDGDREVPAGQFYSKLAQRIMHIFNTRMSSGMLYELDLRLRPSGNSGVLVVHVDTFDHYLNHEAWTWEHQALVRARAVLAEPALQQAFEKIRQQILTLKRDPEKLLTDVVEMREKMRDHLDKSDQQQADIKQGAGGLVDIEFLAQYLVLLHSAQHPKIAQYSDNIRIFERLSEYGVISEDEKNTLIDSYCQLRDRGHRAALQNEKNNISTEEFEQCSQKISEIYQKFLKS
ncbi:bifunctional [glutamate--ammonia ligase]-adenylyl-L-tyrosine phosphorylase/[glutamate--ammonia-ligase] adenylyltransferase [Thalassotalea sp. PLHSN55]|uniref:bifunctional [glutamate--ammonia ligase]-adenylyl-L-tyrosine phosphorylase/[glutamate--ammonia-ligase] adenylyltransferase n=1 Tax=Thalassotalea sp. PLHSN55 TaxID=3435888 RepID=UPI003F86CBDD